MIKENDTPQISIVVPFFNEEDNVEELYTRLVRVLDAMPHSYELLFIDDGSSDGTFAVMTKIYQKDPRVRAFRLRRNFGQTPALQAGFDHARGDIIISMDGDLQHDPDDIPAFIAKMEEGFDIVSGWRKKRVDNFWLRRLPSLIANRMMRFLIGVKIHDFGTTFKAYRKNVIKGLHLYGELHRFIPALTSRKGFTITEIPIKNIVRQKGKSKYGLSRVRRVFLDLISVKFIVSFIDRPLQFFGPIGLVLGVIGFIIALIVAVGFYFFGWAIQENMGNLLLAVFLMILGLQFIMTGLLAEVISRIYFRTHKMNIYSVAESKSRVPEDDEE